MARVYCKPLRDQTVITVLHRVRQVIIRDQKPGQEHVDALLRMYGIDPDELPTAAKRYRPFRRGELSAIVRQALQDGAQTTGDVAEVVRDRAPWLSRQQARGRARECLRRVKASCFKVDLFFSLKAITSVSDDGGTA